MATKVITQFVYLEGLSAGSEFRLCDLDIPMSDPGPYSPNFSENWFKSYADADKALNDSGNTSYAQSAGGGGKLWGNFETPRTTEAGDGVMAVRAIVWSRTRIAEQSIQPERPFWIVSLNSRRVLVMAESVEQAKDFHQKAKG